MLRYKQRHPHVFKHRVAYYVMFVTAVSLAFQVVMVWSK